MKIRPNTESNIVGKKALLSLALLAATLLFTGCAERTPAGEVISEGDTVACDEFFALSNPYDGSNESLWDADSMDSYQRDVYSASEYADSTELLDYFYYLDRALDDVTSAQTDGSSKNDVESLMSDVERAESDVSDQCDIVLY